jgi:hypothetical protein
MQAVVKYERVRKCSFTRKVNGMVLFWLFCFSLNGNAQSVTEYQVKAVFIYNFTHFIQWPSTAFTSDTSSFVIAVLGNNAFGSYLEQTVSGESYKNHPIEVRYYQNISEINNAHILYIDKSFALPGNAISALKNKPVLTVSDNEDFMAASGILRFFTDKNKIRLQINPEAAKQSGLEVSSKLLSLATIYHNN